MGSEMCIRDRFCGDEAVEKAYFQGDMRELRMCLDNALGPKGLETVSYTHLTLPTIYSV